jgi:hypothetical protein
MSENADRIFHAAMMTIEYVGPVPNGAQAARDHLRKWCELIKVHDPQLRTLSDGQIRRALEHA